MALGKNSVLSEAQLVEHFISLINPTISRYQQKRPSVSSSGLCGRRVSLENLTPTGKASDNKSSQFYFTVANAIEQQIVDIYGGHVVANNIRFDNNNYTGEKSPLHDLPLFEGLPHTFGGEIDLILKIKDSYYLFDVKSTSRVKSGNYILVDDSGDTQEKYISGKNSNKQYEAQVKLYSAISGFDNCYLFYIPRNIQEGFKKEPTIKVKKVSTNEDDLINAVAITTYGYLCAELGLVADSTKNIKKSHCGFCSFKEYCWDNKEFEFSRPGIETSLNLKNKALRYAKQYVSNRKSRNQMILEVLDGK